MKRRELIIPIICAFLIPVLNIYVQMNGDVGRKMDLISTMILFVFVYIFTQIERKNDE
jgi:hypothetical protein